jgi:hypothetical protein
MPENEGGFRCWCEIEPCQRAGFDNINDLMYHCQEKHGMGYYRRPKPDGYDGRYGKREADQVASGRS